MIVCVVVGGVISNGAQHIRVELRCAMLLRYAQRRSFTGTICRTLFRDVRTGEMISAVV